MRSGTLSDVNTAADSPVPGRVDAHVHVWPTDRTTYPATPGVVVPPVVADASLLVAELDAHAVDTAIAVATPWFEHDNAYLLAARDAYPNRFALVGYLADPGRPGAADELIRQHTDEGVVGFRFHILDEAHATALESGRAAPVLDAAAAAGTPINLLIQHQGWHSIVAVLARRHPQTRFVVDHLGWVHAGEPGTEVLRLGRHDNVSVKLSAHLVLSDAGYPWTDLNRLQDALLDAFGVRRLMWASNWPMPPTRSASYEQRLTCLVEHLGRLSPSEQGWVFGGTARSLWRLP